MQREILAATFLRSNVPMAASNVRSIESLQRLRETLISLSSDWRSALQELRFALRRIEEDFTTQWPAYWNRQRAAAEASLQEALDNLSRMQSIGSGGSYPATEAQQRVNAARRRVAYCQDKQTQAKRLALVIAKACQDLAGPVAELDLHAEVELPRAAIELATLVDHLSRYAEIQSGSSAAPAVRSAELFSIDTAEMEIPSADHSDDPSARPSPGDPA